MRNAHTNKEVRRKRSNLRQHKNSGKMPNTEIITYLRFKEIFAFFERNGLTIPSTSLDSIESIDEQVEYFLENMNPIELIQFSSFLNMICQSYGFNMAITRGLGFLQEAQIAIHNDFSRKILFHRESLLNLIGFLLEKNISGNEQLTGQGLIINKQKYAKSLLLNNDKLNMETAATGMATHEIILKDYFIREWPHYYLPTTAMSIYGHRIVRYRYCYTKLLGKLKKEAERLPMQNAIKTFETEVGVPLKNYFHVIDKLFSWFLEWPCNREALSQQTSQVQIYGFDIENIHSYYINSKVFAKDQSFVNTIEMLSKDIVSLKSACIDESNKQRDIISGYNKYIRVFFDNPVFKISEDYYCILDLKFLLENVCGGLLWRLKGQANLQDFKSAYGRLMEEYFKFIIKKIFSKLKITFGDDSGADAVIESGDNILVFEFTTEYYRMASLYNSSASEFLDDAYRILFNTGPDDPKSRGKRDKGKLLKLNKYISDNSQEGKNIIPVLVTENFLGDTDLLNSFNDFYLQEISDKNLGGLSENEPLFLSLDDLETFWEFCQPKDSVEKFVELANEWRAAEKGPHFHSPSVFMVKTADRQENGERVINKDFVRFFSSRKDLKYWFMATKQMLRSVLARMRHSKIP